MNFAAFLTSTTAKLGAATNGLGSDGSGITTSGASFDATDTSVAGNVIYVKDKTSIEQGDFVGSATSGKIAVATNTNYVIIAKGAANADTIYYVEVGTDAASATVTPVGTMNTPAAAFDAGNFA